MGEIVDLSEYRLGQTNYELIKHELIARLAGKVGAYATIETNPAWAILPAGNSLRLVPFKGQLQRFENVFIGCVDEHGMIDFITGDGKTPDENGILGYETSIDSTTLLEITSQPSRSRQ